MTDLSTWYTEAEAAELLGISDRTLRRKCDDGVGPERQLRPVPGRKPEPVYRPEDVERMKPPRAMVLSDRSPLAAPQAPVNGVPAMPVDTMAAISAMFERAIERAAEIIADRLPQAAPSALWLTIDQAARYTGLSQTLIALLVRGRKIRAFRDHATKVLRTDLDTLADPSKLSKWREELGGATNELRQAVAERKARRA